ncbi:MAG: hypothetical protein RBT80_27220 [Candidatus Vecturithrix sp.]|jgi:hypothetical protein|nr:hypothetical protein [Candidatus Vecturithrix sp.]
MINDYKHYRARPRINKDRIVSFLLFIALILVLAVRLEPASAEPQLAVVTYDCAPAIELDMPIEGMRL